MVLCSHRVVSIPELWPPGDWAEGPGKGRCQSQWPSGSAHYQRRSGRTVPTLCPPGSEEPKKQMFWWKSQANFICISQTTDLSHWTSKFQNLKIPLFLNQNFIIEIIIFIYNLYYLLQNFMSRINIVFTIYAHQYLCCYLQIKWIHYK